MEESEKRQFYESVGKKIKRARTLYGINQAALGGKVGISRVSIVNIEGGKQMPPVHVIWRMAETFNISIENLFPTLGTTFSTIDPEKNVKLIGAEVKMDSLKSIFIQLDPNKND